MKSSMLAAFLDTEKKPLKSIFTFGAVLFSKYYYTREM